MILDKIVYNKRLKLYERKKIISLSDIKSKANKIVSNEGENLNIFKDILSKDKLLVIGEFKKASPSKGIICENFDIIKILSYYNSMKVDAFSILTEEDFFKGNDLYLKCVRKNSSKPILRKDFIIDIYQIYEAKIIGANGVLLIASILKDNLLEFYNVSKSLNLQPLVEVHNKEELDLALKCNCDVIGINNRNLKDFSISLNTTKELIKYIPKDKIVISESGIKSLEDLKAIKSY